MKQRGFTLIELIVVIVILGVLAAVALPKFVDLQKDARLSVMSGVEGAMRAAASMVYAKALIDGVEGRANSTVTISTGTTVDTRYGYPQNDQIIGLLTLEPASDFDITVNVGRVRYAKSASPTNCEVDYAQAASAGAEPVFAVDLSNC